MLLVSFDDSERTMFAELPAQGFIPDESVQRLSLLIHDRPGLRVRLPHIILGHFGFLPCYSIRWKAALKTLFPEAVGAVGRNRLA